MAKFGKMKSNKSKNNKKTFQGQKKKSFVRDIRPMKKRKLEGSSDKVLSKKQMKKNFFSKRQYEQKEFAAKKMTEENVLRKINEVEAEENNSYQQFLHIFGAETKSQTSRHSEENGGSDDDEKQNDIDEHEESESDDFHDDDDEEEEEMEEEEDDQDDTHIKDDEGENKIDVDEGSENEVEEEFEDQADEDSGVDDIKDPYKEHFGRTLDIEAAMSLLGPSRWNVEKVQIPNLGEATMMFPPSTQRPHLRFDCVDIEESSIKLHILKQFKTLSQKYPLFSPKSGGFSELQESLFPVVNSYMDLYFPNRTPTVEDELMFLYCLHALNHVTKIRNIVIKNNMKIKERIEKRKNKKKKNDDEDDHDRNIQDQGYSRPKVLILVPFRNCALKIVNVLVHLLASQKAMVSQKIRFMNEYGPPEEDTKKGLKPDDFEKTFVGNTDENFRIGISIAKKTLKLYDEFYSSDIIIASPLGLKEVVEPTPERGMKKSGDHMFLSSIEVLIVDKADVLLMQNWNNVVTVLNHLNKQPKAKFTADIARIKDWYINGWQHLYRQTMVFSAYQTPEINGMFQKFASNYAGKCVTPVRLSKPTMCNILSSLPQAFRRFNVKSIEDITEARFQFFIKRVFPAIRNSPDDHVIIFIPSYYDFIRLRKYLKGEAIEFEEICEYTQKERVSRARQFFFEGRMKFLLYTERFHYYYRYFIRGVHHLIFYDLPVNAQLYPELCNMVVDYKKEIVPVNTSCTVLYSKYDVQKLTRIAGVERVNEMISSDEDTFNYVSVDN